MFTGEKDNAQRHCSTELPSSSKAQPYKRVPRQWIYQAGTNIRAFATFLIGLVDHCRYTRVSSSRGHRPKQAVLDKGTEWKTSEKLYRINDGGRVLKRSLREDEYYKLGNGELLTPVLVVERLKNEAACMAYIRENTKIPVPKILDAYEADGSYHLWMEYIEGVDMNELTADEQSQVLPQITSIVAALRELRSRSAGGPTGILSPPSMVYFYHLADWEQQTSVDEDYVFCHGDLSQSNILVDRTTLQIAAIIDWEYGGFYPQEHEIPYYECSKPSGIQAKGGEFQETMDRIIEFWEQSQSSPDQ